MTGCWYTSVLCRDCCAIVWPGYYLKGRHAVQSQQREEAEGATSRAHALGGNAGAQPVLQHVLVPSPVHRSLSCTFSSFHSLRRHTYTAKQDVDTVAAGDVVAMFGVDCSSMDTFTDGR